MTAYSIKISVPEGRVNEILEELQQAQNTIFHCYNELQRLGVVTIEEQKSETASDN